MSEQEKPPYGNTGVQNTQHSALIALVDWFQCTLQYCENPRFAIELLGLNYDDFTIMLAGKYGYKSNLKFGHINIYYEPSETYKPDIQLKMGVHIEMSGQGCREYELIKSTQTSGHDMNLDARLLWKQLCARILENLGQFSRLDCSIDDIRYFNDKPYFTVEQLLKKHLNGEVRSKFKFYRQMSKGMNNTGENLGRTIYIGSDKSSCMFRIYEKHHERKGKGYELEENLTCWNRFEMQLRDERANEMAKHIASDELDLGENILSVINHYLVYVNRSHVDTNKARWKASLFWKKFLHDVGKLKLVVAAPDRTIETRKKWIDDATPKTIAMLYHAGELNEYDINDMIIEGTEKLKEKDFIEIELHLMKKKQHSYNLDNISYENLLRLRYKLFGKPFMTQEENELGIRIMEKIAKIEAAQIKRNQPNKRIDSEEND